MHFFSKFIFGGISILLVSVSCFGMRAEERENLPQRGIKHAFTILGTEGKLFQQYAGASIETGRNGEMEARISKLLGPLYEDIEKGGKEPRWFIALGLSSKEIIALEDFYKALCKEFSKVEQKFAFSGQYFFPKSFQMLCILKAGINLKDGLVKDVLFMSAFYDFCMFKRGNAERFLKEFSKAQDYYSTIDYHSLFQEVQNTFFKEEKTLELEAPQKTQRRERERHFRSDGFLEICTDGMETGTQEEVTWQVKTRMSRSGTEAYLSEICDFSDFAQSHEFFRTFNFLQLERFVGTLIEAMEKHFNPLKDLLDKDMFPLEEGNLSGALLRSLKDALSFPPLLKGEDFYEILKAEMGLEVSVLMVEGGLCKGENLKYYILPSLVKDFEKNVWGLLFPRPKTFFGIEDFGSPIYFTKFPRVNVSPVDPDRSLPLLREQPSPSSSPNNKSDEKDKMGKNSHPKALKKKKKKKISRIRPVDLSENSFEKLLP